MDYKRIIMSLFVLAIVVDSKVPSTDFTKCISVFCGESYNYKHQWYQDCVDLVYQRCAYLL